MSSYYTIVVGKDPSGEFKHHVANLSGWATLRRATNLDHAIVLAKNFNEKPDLVILLQTRPGEFAESDVSLLRAVAPLARLVVLLGSWCEGEQRTGKPLPGVVRIYAHQWEARGQRELENIALCRRSTWDLPPTSSPVEQVLADCQTSSTQQRYVVGIVANDSVTASTLCSACHQLGHVAIWLAECRAICTFGLDAIVLDDPGNHVAAESRIHQFLSADPSTPILVLVNYPRSHDICRMKKAGASAVISKPFMLADLESRFEAIIQRPNKKSCREQPFRSAA